MPYYLSEPGIISCLGQGITASLTTLLNPNAQPLTPSNKWIIGKEYFFGEIQQALPDLSTMPHYFQSRNNQILASTLDQIQPIVQQAIDRYGSERVGVVIGTSTTSADENAQAFLERLSGKPWENIHFTQDWQEMSNPADFTAYYLGINGLCYGISTACTSSARALISATRLLQLGLCDAVVCGGADVLSKLTINGFHSLQVLSSSIANPFSKNRNGINIGEAGAVFVMTKEPPPWLYLRFYGYGASSDAYHMSSPRPDGSTASQAIELALKSANLNTSQIGWINLHGTGTQQNDSMESIAVHQHFANHTYCTSTKPLTGHTLGASGAIEASIAWILASRQYNPTGSLPKHHWDHQIDKELPTIQLTDEHSHWVDNQPRIALSASYAFGGNNAVLILGEE